MRRSTLVTCALLTVATFGCKKAKPPIDKASGREPAAPQLAQGADTARGDTTAAPAGPPLPEQSAQPVDTTRGDTTAAPAGPPAPAQPAQRSTRRPLTPRARPVIQGPARLLRDEPYLSKQTGTIAPGMSEREISASWGAPAAVRRLGEFTYLFFRNSCEYTCGTMDLVTLQNGRVVDAIVRWPGHRYSGESSSPPGTKPHPNRRGNTLTLPRSHT